MDIAGLCVIALLALIVALVVRWLFSPESIGHTFRLTGGMQEARWASATIRPTSVARIDKAIARYLDTRDRYQSITAQRQNGVPSSVIFTLHGRESSWSFKLHLHNGDPLTGKTYRVPAGRLPHQDPPYTFEQSAEDALYVVDGLDKVQWQSLGHALQAIERYNGLGYQRKGLPSPYLWAGTTAYLRGKYVRDGVFDPMAEDKQLGCAAILKRMKDRGLIKII